jgi:hypothetical protein
VALDFPDSPSNGDYYEGFVYDSTAGAWRVSKLPAQGIFAVLAVGGGGGGGAANNRGGGGGGAGEFFEGTLALPNSFLVTVGEGGIAWTAPTNGEDTIIHTLGLRGGDKGGGYTTVGGNSYPFQGGSGGGDDTAAGAGVSIAFPFAQGNNGGDGSTNRGGGGGGASSAGASGAVSGNGGAGVTSTITGSSVGYAGGGGAGFKSGSAGTASDGGGAGGASNDDGTAGTANTGGGGGGASSISTSYDRGGGVGGSGIVILKYPKEITLGIGAGLTSTTSTVGNYKVTQFTAGTDTVTF